MGDFFFDLRWGGGLGEGGGDVGAEGVAVAFAEAVGGDFEGGLGEAEGGGELGVGLREFAGEKRGEGVEEGGLAGGGIAGAEGGEHLIEQREGPAAFEEAFGGEGVDGFEGVAGFGIGRRVEGEEGVGSAALLGAGVVALVADEMSEGGEKEGAELAFGGAEGGEIAAGEQIGEEALGEVFGLVGGVAAAAEVGVEREPVDAQEIVEGAAGAGGLGIGGEDEGPARGEEADVGMGGDRHVAIIAGGGSVKSSSRRGV